MNKKLIAPLIVLGVLLLIVLIMTFAPMFTYERYDVIENDGVNSCEHYYEKCKCYGWVTVLFSYPAQYRCTGLELFCTEIDRYEGELCEN